MRAQCSIIGCSKEGFRNENARILLLRHAYFIGVITSLKTFTRLGIVTAKLHEDDDAIRVLGPINRQGDKGRIRSDAFSPPLSPASLLSLSLSLLDRDYANVSMIYTRPRGFDEPSSPASFVGRIRGVWPHRCLPGRVMRRRWKVIPSKRNDSIREPFSFGRTGGGGNGP